LKKTPLIKCILILHYHPKTKPANHNHYRWAAKHEQYHYRWAAGGDSGTVGEGLSVSGLGLGDSAAGTAWAVVRAWRASQIRTIHAEEEAGAVGVSAEAGARTEVVWSQGDAEALGVSAARTSAFVGETEVTAPAPLEAGAVGTSAGGASREAGPPPAEAWAGAVGASAEAGAVGASAGAGAVGASAGAGAVGA